MSQQFICLKVLVKIGSDREYHGLIFFKTFTITRVVCSFIILLADDVDPFGRYSIGKDLITKVLFYRTLIDHRRKSGEGGGISPD